MKHILILGAGKSSTVLIEYMLAQAQAYDWHIHIADIDLASAARKVNMHPRGTAHRILKNDPPTLQSLIQRASLVISLLPPDQHTQVAEICLQEGRHFLNASYLTEEIKAMDAEARKKGLLFLVENGLDPGIDHMSAMSLIDGIRKEGGKISSFQSHCGGLIAPACDDNPWHYKFSWNPRNVIMAGKDGAIYRHGGQEISIGYDELFDPKRTIEIPGLGSFAWYPNRNSLPYLPLYGMEEVPNFVRTTLRHPDFCFGWKNLVTLRLTDDTIFYDTDGMSLTSFFQIHFDRFGFSEWLNAILADSFQATREHLDELISLLQADHARDDKERGKDDIMLVNQSGDLKSLSISESSNQAAKSMQDRMHEAKLTLTQLFYLGLGSGEMINQGKKSAAEILQWVMEKKLSLAPHDRDMIVMMHEVDYSLHGMEFKKRSTLILEGEDPIHTAMAKTVGLPLGIAAKLILTGGIQMTGVQIPVHPEIYEKILPELRDQGVVFSEHVLPGDRG